MPWSRTISSVNIATIFPLSILQTGSLSMNCFCIPGGDSRWNKFTGVIALIAVVTILPTPFTHHHHHHHHHQSLNREGLWGTIADFTTSFLHFSLFSIALWDLVNTRPVHFLMLSSHLFFCLPCPLPPFTVPWKKVLARPDEQETWPFHCHLRLFTMVWRSLRGPDLLAGSWHRLPRW